MLKCTNLAVLIALRAEKALQDLESRVGVIADES